MNGCLGAATVTAVLKRRLEEALEPVKGAKVDVGYPKKPSGSGTARVSLYLFQAEHNGARSNQSLPTMSAEGARLDPSTAVLDLFYLITFYGDQGLAQERMLGRVAAVLQAQPLITRAEIEREIHDGLYSSELAGSKLAEQRVVVRLTPVQMELEDWSKLWTVFDQAAHRLSLVYRAASVSLTVDDQGGEALPVMKREFHVSEGPAPRVEAISPQVVTFGAKEPIVVRGTGFDLPELSCFLGVDSVPFQVKSAEELWLAPFPLHVAAGVQEVQVDALPSQAGGVRRSSGASSAIVIRPVLEGDVTTESIIDPRTDKQIHTVQLECHPLPRETQDCRLLLNPISNMGDLSTARSLGPPLQFGIESTALASGHSPGTSIPKAIVDGFKSQGITLGERAKLTDAGANRYLLVDSTPLGEQRYLLHQGSRDVTVCFGLSTKESSKTLAFQFHAGWSPGELAVHLDPGEYLVRIQIGGSTRGTSLLEQSAVGQFQRPVLRV